MKSFCSFQFLHLSPIQPSQFSPGGPTSPAFVGTGGLDKALSFAWEMSCPEAWGEQGALPFLVFVPHLLLCPQQVVCL